MLFPRYYSVMLPSLGESRAQNNSIIDCRLRRRAARGMRQLAAAATRGGPHERTASDVGGPAAGAVCGAARRTAPPCDAA